jgi:uncharacterized protein (DUF2132 family)
MSEKEKQANNPMHGITLEMIINALVKHYGWGELGMYVKIRCFNKDPSVKSSLKFLRKTPWARKKVEELYLEMLMEKDEQSESPRDPWAGCKHHTQ